MLYTIAIILEVLLEVIAKWEVQLVVTVIQMQIIYMDQKKKQIISLYLEDGDNIQNATKQGMLNKSTLTSTVLANFGSNFKSDYEEESVNDGFPILSWQSKE